MISISFNNPDQTAYYEIRHYHNGEVPHDSYVFFLSTQLPQPEEEKAQLHRWADAGTLPMHTSVDVSRYFSTRKAEGLVVLGMSGLTDMIFRREHVIEHTFVIKTSTCLVTR